MTKPTIAPPPFANLSCSCETCLCRRGPRCRCHDYNALLALALDPRLPTMRSLELKIPPVALTLLLGGLMWATTLIGSDFGFTFPGRRILAAGLIAAGGLIAVLGVVSFRRAKTTVNPLHPETVSALVVSGIYQLTRNPMYLGLLLVLLGWAVGLANGLTFIFPVAYVPVMNRLQIIPEERALAAMFGRGFADYKSKVRRWL